MIDRTGTALVDPARLAEGLRAPCSRAGGVVHERTPVTGLRDEGERVEVGVDGGAVVARRVLLATGASPPLLRRVRAYVAPVYDYVLMTEPVTGLRARVDRLEAAPGHVRRRQPLPLLPADRRRPDPLGRLRGGLPLPRPGRGRVGSRTTASAACSPSTSSRRSRSSRACASPTAGAARSTRARASARSAGTAHDGRVAYAVGYTGLGVGREPLRRPGRARPARRAATEATALELVRSKPVPVPARADPHRA